MIQTFLIHISHWLKAALIKRFLCDYMEVEFLKYIKKELLFPLQNFSVESLSDLRKLHQELINIRAKLWIEEQFQVMPHYRGEQKLGWDILPGIFRPPYNNGYNEKQARIIEERGVKLFIEEVSKNIGKEMLFPLNTRTKTSQEWDVLFQAQHAGVKTNLIDVTDRIELAGYFATEPSLKFDKESGQIWCILVPTHKILNSSSIYDDPTYHDFNPYKLNESFVCNVPTYIDTIKERIYQLRLFRQHGRLFASANHELTIPLNKRNGWENLILQVEIKPEIKKRITSELNALGTTKESLIRNENEASEIMINYINTEMKRI